jgi:hypothetical protein
MSGIRLAGAGFMFLVATICVVIANLRLLDAVREANSKAPEGERIDPLGWHPFKYARFHRLYRGVCPDGRSLRQSWFWSGAAFVAFAGFTILFGFFGH